MARRSPLPPERHHVSRYSTRLIDYNVSVTLTLSAAMDHRYPIQFTNQTNRCEDAYNDKFDSSKCAASNAACKTQADALELAKEYRAAQSQTT